MDAIGGKTDEHTQIADCPDNVTEASLHGASRRCRWLRQRGRHDGVSAAGVKSKNASDGEQISALNAFGAARNPEPCRASPMEIATRYQPSTCSRFALQSATQRHLSTPASRRPDGDSYKAGKPFIIRLPEAGSGLIGDKPLFAAQRDAIARQI